MDPTKDFVATPPPPANRARPILAMTLLIAGAGLLLFHGSLVSSDEIVMARETFAIAREGRLTFPPIYGRTTSEYGIVASLQGVPWTWLEAAVQALGLMKPKAPITLLTLANLVDVILLALYFRAMALRLGASERAAGGSAVLLILATPFLPYAESFFSEPATALAIAGAAFHLGIPLRERNAGPIPDANGQGNERDKQDPRTDLQPLLAGAWIAVALHLRIITGALWPLWAGWLWWRCRSESRTRGETLRLFGRLALFPAVGIILLLVLNTLLRGGPFHMGYATSAFTTPLPTGLHGLLFSPARGLFIQAPLAYLGVWAWFAFWPRLRRTGLFCLAILGIWIGLHATFWTWHGGWTPGPRFLLPVLPFVLLPLPLLLTRWPEWGGGRRLLLILIVGWGVVQAVAQTLVNPLDWNNELWGFLQETESRFLFEPQVSSWEGIWTLIGDGALRPVWWPGNVNGMAPIPAVLFGVLGFFGMAGGLLCAGRKRVGAACRDAWCVWRHWALGTGRPLVICALVVAIVLSAASLLSGPRGMVRETRTATAKGKNTVTETFDKRMRWGWPDTNAKENKNAAPALERVTWEGYFDLPLQGRYVFYLKARGVYTMNVNGKMLFANDDPAKPQHIPHAAIELGPGRYPVQIVFGPDNHGGGVFRLFWQWPGEGIEIQPLDSEYVLPRALTPVERAATQVRRNGFLVALILLLAVAVATQPGRKRREADP